MGVLSLISQGEMMSALVEKKKKKDLSLSLSLSLGEPA